MADVDELLSELEDVFDRIPPPEALTIKEMVDKLRARGFEATETSVRLEMRRRLDSGEWTRGRVGVRVYYWKVK